MKIFENKTVLITGGTSGIGKATALAFAKEGANVLISGRRVARGEELAKEITSAGGSALFVQTDVTREEDIVALIEKTVETFGALHIAFNNAGAEGRFGLLTTPVHEKPLILRAEVLQERGADLSLAVTTVGLSLQAE